MSARHLPPSAGRLAARIVIAAAAATFMAWMFASSSVHMAGASAGVAHGEHVESTASTRAAVTVPRYFGDEYADAEARLQAQPQSAQPPTF
ncbi:hypothetical protein LMG19087_01779 [Ralstonia wenshanensis]|jgi:hypothetical protein|uniref:hypothetical protein n=1 Tax=Ralstonia wenshanensis TaxID=2842456 RepID=UPI0028F50056|nr:hypothetical protein [Ralstonia wenshanensis]CAJ0813490.1 hypothetical protein LMG19087_01779 [Ralstonia wenshanensis]